MMDDNITTGHVLALESMGHKVVWSAVLWDKPYIFMKDHEGSLYLTKVKEDGSLEIL